MSAEVFIDSNIWLYAFLKNPEEEFKHERARSTIASSARRVVSAQVIAEVCNNLLRKGGMTEVEVLPIIADFYGRSDAQETNLACHRVASQLRLMHHFSFWDSLIVASAIEAGCHTLLTEDMQHGQLVAGQITILNPFLEASE